MKIEVETKFNIGDSVYVPEPCMSWLATNEPSKITGVQVRYRLKSDGEIVMEVFYELSNETFPCNEAICFATYEESQQWCNKRNEEDGVL